MNPDTDTGSWDPIQIFLWHTVCLKNLDPIYYSNLLSTKICPRLLGPTVSVCVCEV